MKPKIIGQAGDLVIVQDATYHIVGFRPIDRDTYNDWTDLDYLCGGAIEYVRELWIMAVNSNHTDKGLLDYAQEIIAVEGSQLFWDDSYCELWDTLRESGFDEENWPVFSCNMCGCYKNEKYEKFEPENWGIENEDQKRNPTN